MSFAGHSHFGYIVAIGVIVVLVFVALTELTKASRREVIGALVGGVAAGAINIAMDAAAHRAGFWRYTEVTTPFGPLLYYIEAGFGCGALALLMLWLGRRGGRRSQLWFLAVVAVYTPLRDCAAERLTHLIEFHYDPFVLVVIADSLSEFVIPLLVAYGVILLFTRARQSPKR
jgi:hypothetical protein